MTRPTVIVDCETTSLDPETGEIWELAAIEYGEDGERSSHLWRMEPHLASADPGALQVGRYYERTAGMCTQCRSTDRAYDLAEGGDEEWSAPSALAPVIARLLDGVTIVAANPAFDAGFLAAFLRQNKQAPTWHYRMRDIGSMAYGYLGCLRDAPCLPIDASTDELARAIGVNPEDFERHSALGDCKLVTAMLDVITGGKP